jgi:CheY-like chemotaxis protein
VSGFEVCQQIRVLDPERQTKIVFVSGASSPSTEYVERCATFADGDAFLRKPYDFRELLSIITHSNIPHSSYSECEA